MAVIQLNAPDMPPDTPGYISSLTVWSNGVETVLDPDQSTGQITVDAEAATKLTQDISRIRLIVG